MKSTKFNDLQIMNATLNLARPGIGDTGENPSVGCSIVASDGELIAAARTGENGRPHAESIALEMAGERAKGATMYVTLEPCSHYGDTTPCVEAIIRAGIERVVVAVEDPDHRVSGSGIKALVESNIDVTVGVCQKEAMSVNVGYFYRKNHNRPFITLKVATTLDGKIGSFNGDSKWITTMQSRKFANKFRSMSDAILIGKGTLVKDNPFLDCTLPGLEKRKPKKIILDSVGDISDPELNIFKKGETWIFGAKNESEHFKNFEIPIIDKKVDIKALVVKLAELGINNLLVEGGNRVATEFLRLDLIDRIIWFRASKIAGNDAIAVFGDLNLSCISNFFNLARKESLEIGDNTMEILLRKSIDAA